MIHSPSSNTLLSRTVALLLISAPVVCASEKIHDITDAILTERSTDCAAYAGSYHSSVKNHVSDETVNGHVTIGSTADICTFTINQIPNHDFGQHVHWPHDAAENEEIIQIPRQPSPAANPTETGLGPSAIMLNGVMWEPNPAACFGEGKDSPGNERIGCGPRHMNHPWRYNIGSELNKFSFDDYYAHVQKGGIYHYHSTPRVLYTSNARLLSDDDCSIAGPSPVIGFALDGFPIYGPCLKDDTGTVRAARSSYQLKNGLRKSIEGYETPYVVGGVKSAEYNGQFVGDFQYVAGSGDLDQCNGLFIDGQYGYYATNAFPYAMRCLTGTAIMPVR